MEVTNKTLGLLLIAAIVVSLGGTFVSLNKLGGTTTTGYATNNETGTVSLSVGDALSIVISGDATIPFGECIPDVTEFITVSSALPQASLNNSACSGTGSFPDNITLNNDGNVDANVTVTSTQNATSLFDVAGGSFYYKIGNATGDAGCMGTLQNAWVNFTNEHDGLPTTLDENPVCDNLTFTDSGDSVGFSAQLEIPPVTTTAGSATIYFRAEVPANS